MTEILLLDYENLLNRMGNHLTAFCDAVRNKKNKTAEYEQGYADAVFKVSRVMMDYQKGKEAMKVSELIETLQRLPADAVVMMKGAKEIRAASVRAEIKHSTQNGRGQVMVMPTSQVVRLEG